MIHFRNQVKFDKQATVVLVEEGQLKSHALPFRQRELTEQVSRLSQSGQFSAENGEIFPLLVGKKIFVLVGVGKKEKASLTALRITVRKALLSPYLKKIRTVELVSQQTDAAVIQAIIEGVLIGTYVWRKYISKRKDDQSVDAKEVTIVGPAKSIFEETVTVCEGVNFARDLVNDNADVVHSEYLEKVIRGLIKGSKNVSLEILNRKELKAKGLNLHLAVNQGSNKEPKLIIVRYQGGTTQGNATALVGKGLTFDTGGINLKPSGHIETMRMDMSGAAAVIGTLKNVLALKLKKNVIFAVAVAENAIDANAYKPGDVFRGYSGKTVEIGNTDAEGRLVLADAISYVVKNYQPSRIVDIATLTGACIIALGYDYSGLVTNNDGFSRQMIRASNETDDRAWRLPSYPEIKDYVKSSVADIKNVGLPKGAAGAITAAEFLRQFTEDKPWVHLDIAGTAFVEGKERMYYGLGATGAGVRLLTHYLKSN